MIRIDLSWKDEEDRKEEYTPPAEDTDSESTEAQGETMLITEPEADSAEAPVKIEEHVRQEIRADLDNSETVEMPAYRETPLAGSPETRLPEDIAVSGSSETLSPEEMLVAELPDVSAPQETPAGEENDFTKVRRSPSEGEKVPLSDFVPETPHPTEAVMPSADIEFASTESQKRKPRGLLILVAVLAAALVFAAGALLFRKYGGSFIQQLFSSREKTASISSAPSRPGEESASTPADSSIHPSAQSIAESTAVAASPASIPSPSPSTPRSAAPAPSRQSTQARAVIVHDPVLILLDRINKATPARVWITGERVESGGTYEIQGMAFTHDALQAFVAALEKAGTITGKNIPSAATSPDTIYRFSIAGKYGGIDAPGVLGAVSSEQLSVLAKTLRSLRGSSGISIIREPRPGIIYGDDELPFEVEGTYSGIVSSLGKMISKGKYVISHISIQPSASGRPFNRVRVSFSVRTPS
jgi:hypothetical protein